MELVFVRSELTMGVMGSLVVLDNGGDRSLGGILLTLLTSNGKKSYPDPEGSRCWRCS